MLKKGAKRCTSKLGIEPYRFVSKDSFAPHYWNRACRGRFSGAGRGRTVRLLLPAGQMHDLPSGADNPIKPHVPENLFVVGEIDGMIEPDLDHLEVPTVDGDDGDRGAHRPGGTDPFDAAGAPHRHRPVGGEQVEQVPGFSGP